MERCVFLLDMSRHDLQSLQELFKMKYRTLFYHVSLFVDRQQNRRSRARPPLMVKLGGRVKAAPGKYL